MSESEKKELETKISSVTVYQSGVQMTQIGSISLETGEQLIKIPDLPETLDKESIRVKGIGNGKIMNILVEFNSKREYKKEQHKELQEKVERLNKEIQKTTKQYSRLNEQIAKYKQTEDSFHSDWARAFSFGEADLTKFFQFNNKIEEIVKEKMDLLDNLEDKLKELKKELLVIQNKISTLGNLEEIHNFYEITINLNVLKAGDFKIEIRYTMTQAWWIPFYDVTLSENNARLTMMANVHNRTGKDWNNIEIEISTASLKPIRLDKPAPMILWEYYPSNYRYEEDYRKTSMPYGGAPGGAIDLLVDGVISPTTSSTRDIAGEFYPEQKQAIQETYAEVSENIGVQSFKIPNRIDIPSDENPHPVNLSIQGLESKKKYYWSSVAPENVIIQDSLINGELLLLAGNVKIYFMEEFIGETSIPVIAPKEKFKLGTRVSYDLKIEKKLIDRSKGKKAIKGKLKNNYNYKINIKNLKEVTDPLIILDGIPHSSSEYIKVEIETMEPEPEKKELGVLKWKFPTLKDVKEKVIHYKYYIEYKSDIRITPPLP